MPETRSLEGVVERVDGLDGECVEMVSWSSANTLWRCYMRRYGENIQLPFRTAALDALGESPFLSGERTTTSTSIF